MKNGGGGYDLIIGRLSLFYQKRSQIIFTKALDDRKISNLNGIEAYKSILAQNIDYPHSSCVYFIKRDLILQENLFFCVGFTAEDAEWQPRLFSVAKKVAYDGIPFYYSRVRLGSISRSTTPERKIKFTQDRTYIVKKIFEFVDNSDFDELTKSMIRARAAQIFLYAYIDYLDLEIVDMDGVFKNNSSYFKFLKKRSFKWNFRLFLLNIFGYNTFDFVCKMSKLIQKKKNYICRKLNK